MIAYGDLTMSDVLHSKDTKKSASRTQLTFQALKKSISVQILEIVKFLIDTAEEIYTCTEDWVTFHTSKLVYFSASSRFKYLFLPEFDNHQEG
jgi:hypothetical protein